MGHAHSSSSSSKEASKQGSSHSPRKFESYHLPFRKEKGFSKLKRSLFGKKKKTNSGSYQQALSVIAGREQRPKTSTSLQNLPLQTDPSETSTDRHSVEPSDRKSSCGESHFRTWSPRRPCGKPPLPLPLEPATDRDSREIGSSLKTLGERRTLRDENLQCYSKVIADAYSSVVKERGELKPIEDSTEKSRKESSSSSEGRSSHSAFEDAIDELPPLSIVDRPRSKTATAELPRSDALPEVVPKVMDSDAPSSDSSRCPPVKAVTNSVEGHEAVHESSEDPVEKLGSDVRKKSTDSAEVETDSSGDHFGSFGDNGADSSKSSDGSPWVEVGDGMSPREERSDPPRSDGKTVVGDHILESNVPVLKSEEKPDDVISVPESPLPLPDVVHHPQARIQETEEETARKIVDDAAGTKLGLELHPSLSSDDRSEVSGAPEPVPPPAIAELEGAVVNTLELKVMATVDVLSDDSLPKPSVPEADRHECLVVAEPSSEAEGRTTTSYSPKICPTHDETVVAVNSSELEESGHDEGETKVTNSWSEKNAPLRLDKRTSEEFDLGAVSIEVRRSEELPTQSPNPEASVTKRESSSSEEKVSHSGSSASSIGDDIWDDDDHHDVQSAEGIKTKLVLDLLTNLEVDMGDFQAFLELPDGFEDKYQLLPFPEFLASNLEMGISLDALGRCFRVLSKYGLNLLKPEAEELKFLKKVIVPHDLPTGHWLCVQGAKDVLRVFGYEERGNCLIFPVDEEPDVESTAAWVIEMLLAAHEISAHTLGSHPHPEFFDRYAPETGDRNLPRDPEERPVPEATTSERMFVGSFASGSCGSVPRTTMD